MAWIELHQELRNHPKVLRLAEDIQQPCVFATGCLVNLWMWSAAYAQSGDITNFSDAEIDDACGVKIGTGIRKALLKTGWVDQKNSKQLVHDWKKHGLKLLESNRERVRKHRERKALEGENEDYGNVTVTSTVPNLTNQPNLTMSRVYAVVVSDWNDFAMTHGLKAVMALNETRKAGIRSRIHESQFDLPKIFDAIGRSPFLCGSNDRGWSVDFDFVFCSPNKYIKILEGKYDGKPNAQPSSSRQTFTGDTVRELTRDTEALIASRKHSGN
jgi:hypothetical protein